METELMKKYILLITIVLLINILLSPTLSADIFREYEKVIWIDQLKQVGAAYESYERWKKVREFPVLTGDDETTTDPGIYVVRVKQKDYYSRKYQTPMPYSIFFNYKERVAIHEGEVPPPQKRIGLASHGCVHVEQPHMRWLYDWTEVGRTLVVIVGRRTQD
jgi:lipoprotein-anchoring transpeptidase ErfK/SrfK